MILAFTLRACRPSVILKMNDQPWLSYWQLFIRQIDSYHLYLGKKLVVATRTNLNLKILFYIKYKPVFIYRKFLLFLRIFNQEFITIYVKVWSKHSNFLSIESYISCRSACRNKSLSWTLWFDLFRSLESCLQSLSPRTQGVQWAFWCWGQRA